MNCKKTLYKGGYPYYCNEPAGENDFCQRCLPTISTFKQKDIVYRVVIDHKVKRPVMLTYKVINVLGNIECPDRVSCYNLETKDIKNIEYIRCSELSHTKENGWEIFRANILNDIERYKHQLKNLENHIKLYEEILLLI